MIGENKVREKAEWLKNFTDEWIEDNIQYFDLFNWECPNEKFYRNKAFNEGGVYLLTGLRNGEYDIVPKLKDLIIERVNEKRFGQILLRNPSDFHYYAYPPLYASYVDSLGRDVEIKLRQVAQQGEFWAKERLPHRYLELCYLSRIFGIHDDYEGNTILRYSLLNNQPNIIYSDCPDAYCLTHDVMLANNNLLYYNEVEFDTTLGKPASYDVTNVIRGLILRFIAEDNPDITLELVLSGILQRQISKEMVRFVLSWIIDKTNDTDYVPGPSKESMPAPVFSQDASKEEDPPWKYDYKDEQDEIWANNYHTNIVAGMTARIIIRDFEKLGYYNMNGNIDNQSFRQEIMYLGELLKYFSNYNLEKGSKLLIELAESPVKYEFPSVFQEAVDFLENQRRNDGNFGYWSSEKNIYLNNGNSEESFQDNLIAPVSNDCRKAINKIKKEGLRERE